MIINFSPGYDADVSQVVLGVIQDNAYRKVSNISGTKCQNLNDSRLVLQLPVPNPLKPSIKSIIQM